MSNSCPTRPQSAGRLILVTPNLARRGVVFVLCLAPSQTSEDATCKMAQHSRKFEDRYTRRTAPLQ